MWHLILFYSSKFSLICIEQNIKRSTLNIKNYFFKPGFTIKILQVKIFLNFRKKTANYVKILHFYVCKISKLTAPFGRILDGNQYFEENIFNLRRKCSFFNLKHVLVKKKSVNKFELFVLKILKLELSAFEKKKQTIWRRKKSWLEYISQKPTTNITLILFPNKNLI